MRTAKINADKIELAFPFNRAIVDQVKEIPSRDWVSSRKVWTVAFTTWHCKVIVEKLLPLGFEIDKKITSEASKPAPKPRRSYPEGLYPFQRDGVDFLFAAGGRALLADEMGLGKTITTLAFMKMYCGKALIVTPSVAVYKWEMEIRKWLGTEPIVQIISKTKEEVDDKADILIMSYAMMVSHYQALSDMPFDIVIYDEAHYLKGRKTQRGRAGRALVKNGIPKVLMLSGTPFLNRLDELFPLVNAIDPAAFSNFYDFARRYMGAVYMDGMWYFPPGVVTNREELSQRLGRLMIRRTKEEVLKDLPELTRATVPVEITNKREYKEALADLRKWVKENSGKEVTVAHKLAKLSVLRQVVGLSKVSAAIELAESVLQDGKKVVLFAHHKAVISQLMEGLKEYGVKCITGETPQKERQENANLFLRMNSQCRVMICSTAGSEAIDLFSASDIVMVERQWTPAREEQMEARLHRMGQKNAVSAYYLVAKGTVDERLDRVVRMKRDTIGQVISQDEVIEEIWSGLED